MCSFSVLQANFQGYVFMRSYEYDCKVNTNKSTMQYMVLSAAL